MYWDKLNEEGCFLKKLFVVLTSLIVLLCSISLPASAEILSKPVLNPDLSELIENPEDSSGDISINASPIIEKKDLGLGAGSISRMTKSQARTFTKSLKMTEHSFKEMYVQTKVSRWDISYHKKTRKVYLMSKDGRRFIDTGYYHTR